MLVNSTLVLPYSTSDAALAIREAVQAIDRDITFWEEKLERTNQGYLFLKKLSICYQRKYEYTGNPDYLLNAEELLLKAHQEAPVTIKGELCQAISRNALRMHKFEMAKRYAEESLNYLPNSVQSQLLSFDALLQLKGLAVAEQQLPNVKYQSIGTVLRLARVKQMKGEEQEAMALLEQIGQKAQKLHPELAVSTWVELAELYIRMGMGEKAVKAYESILKIDPINYTALKGLAWVAYAYDKNIETAKGLLRFLQQNRETSPDILWMLADIAAYQEKTELYQELLRRFMEVTSTGVLRDIYLTKVVELGVDHPEYFPMVLAMAEADQAWRPISSTKELLAWCHHRSGNDYEALRLADEVMQDPTGLSPLALYRLGVIYQDLEESDKSSQLLEKAQEGRFYLGPRWTEELQVYMAKLP
ncbi:hypothetical protein GCM10023331_03970 [Algivirga pacifica]|uniref:Tetratricopeptide repeat-containing protein n=2 Tax=Algivirga pacifica TaxID=1162670 RepID=A0ABP9D2I8_9BACT